MRVLVTGASGFIGRHLVKTLAAEGHTLVTASRSDGSASEEHVRYDFASAEPFPEIAPVDAVVHLAAHSSASDGLPADEIARVNVQGTLTALLVARRSHARFVLASSQRVYRPGSQAISEGGPTEPIDVYGYTKLAAELYTQMTARLFDVPATIPRFFSVYGPGQVVTQGTSGVVSILAQRALAGAPMVVMTRQPKDFVEVSDAVRGIILCLSACRVPSPAYNIATGVPTSVLTLAREIHTWTGSTSPITEDYSIDEPGGLVADIERARQELGYEPKIGLAEGLCNYVNWLRTTR